MKIMGVAVLACSISLLLAAPARRHHGSAAFSVQEEVTVTGTTVEYTQTHLHLPYSVDSEQFLRHS